MVFKISEDLLSWGYFSSKNDYSLFTKYTGGSVIPCVSTSHMWLPLLRVQPNATMGHPISDPSIYRRLIEKLKFLQHTRPDIEFSVQYLSQFLHAPCVPHMLVVLHVVRYLMNDTDLGILISSSSDMSLLAFSDSVWAACAQSKRSITSYYITFGGSPIS
ncbi:uncharacterized mitochondrial protein AtMg00810-like [Nicotiana tomentosiformis]|uniref:uncharacterized mitochondrial protein AtMg00810-like n=1 Tax=Nicotiana tomentosiformis TaxID=4098 RepID=UPI00388C84B4